MTLASVYVSLGSNIQPAKHIRIAVRELHKHFGELSISRVFESEAVGFDGENFYNLVVGFNSELPVADIDHIIHNIEDEYGRDRSQPRFSARTLDIDLLLYDEAIIDAGRLQLPRDEITKNAFVLWPLAEIAPQLKHPVIKQTFNAMWEAFDKTDQALWPIAFDWAE